MTQALFFGPFEAARDNFQAGTEPLSAILNRHGIKSLPGEQQILEADLYYDDWYLYRVPEGTWGLYKMREREQDGGDGDTPGMTVSFIPFHREILVSFDRHYGGEEDLVHIYCGTNCGFFWRTRLLNQSNFILTPLFASYMMVDERFNLFKAKLPLL